MRCYVEGRAKTTVDSIMIDYIEAKKDGKLFVLDWDETELGFDEECDAFGYKKFSGRLKGIKFNDVLLDDEGDLYTFDTEDSNIMYCAEVYED